MSQQYGIQNKEDAKEFIETLYRHAKKQKAKNVSMPLEGNEFDLIKSIVATQFKSGQTEQNSNALVVKYSDLVIHFKRN